MKEQNWRRELECYGFVQDLPSRFADIDIERHVNNVAVHSLHGEACMRFQSRLFEGIAHLGPALMLHPARVDTDFLLVTHYQRVQCGVRLVHVGERDCTLASGLFQDGACVGIQEQRVVVWQGARPGVLTDAMRARLTAHMGGQASLAHTPPASPDGMDDIGAYPFVGPLSARFGDLDADGRIGTRALMRYAEQARTSMVFAALDDSGINARAQVIGLLVARTGIDILARRAADGAIALAAGVTRLGNSSIAVSVGVFDRSGCLATSESILVCVQRDNGRPATMPPALRRVLDERRHRHAPVLSS